MIKSLAESTNSSVTFSLFTEIELAVKARLASPFDLRNPVFVFKISTIFIPSSISFLEISACGTPSKTSRKVASSNCFKSSEVEFPNNIFDAFIAFSKSSAE